MLLRVLVAHLWVWGRVRVGVAGPVFFVGLNIYFFGCVGSSLRLTGSEIFRAAFGIFSYSSELSVAACRI